MRPLIAILVFSSSITFAACPDLSGLTTICRSTTGQVPGNEKQVISQETTNGVTTYTFTYTSQSSEEVTKAYIADGKSRRVMDVDPDSGITLLTATTLTCLDNALLEHTTSFIDGQFLGVMDIKTTKSKNTVTRVYEGIRWGRDIDDTVICE